MSNPTATAPATKQARKPRKAAAEEPSKAPFSIYGVYKGIVHSLVITLTGSRPAIYTRITGTKDGVEKEVTHVVRLRGKTVTSTTALIEIGMGEISSAFPEMFPSTETEDVLTVLLTKTDEFLKKPCSFRIDKQTDQNGKAVLNMVTKKPYYNIRLESALRNLAPKTAASRVAAFMATQENSDATSILTELAQQSHPG
tara:strand:- start:16 stop:609 length:594 start_codon:yes stop_codon:yes gene_type:complete